MDIPKIIINEYDMFCEENCDMEITLGGLQTIVIKNKSEYEEVTRYHG